MVPMRVKKTSRLSLIQPDSRVEDDNETEDEITKCSSGPTGSGHLDLHLLDFVLDVGVTGVLAQAPQVRIPGEPFEIAVTEKERLVQGRNREIEFAVKRVAARQVIKHQRVAGFEHGQLLVHFQTVAVFAPLSVVISQKLQGFDVFRVAPDNAFHEGDFDLEVAKFSASQLLSFCTAFLGHTTPGILPKSHIQVKPAKPLVHLAIGPEVNHGSSRSRPNLIGRFCSAGTERQGLDQGSAKGARQAKPGRTFFENSGFNPLLSDRFQRIGGK